MCTPTDANLDIDALAGKVGAVIRETVALQKEAEKKIMQLNECGAQGDHRKNVDDKVQLLAAFIGTQEALLKFISVTVADLNLRADVTDEQRRKMLLSCLRIVRTAKDSLRVAIGVPLGSAGRFFQRIQSLIERHPWRTVAVGLGVGTVGGLIGAAVGHMTTVGGVLVCTGVGAVIGLLAAGIVIAIVHYSTNGEREVQSRKELERRLDHIKNNPLTEESLAQLATWHAQTYTGTLECTDECIICHEGGFDDVRPGSQRGAVHPSSCSRHFYHRGCLEDWARRGHMRCPYCNR